MEKIFGTQVSVVYGHYLNKILRKGQSQEDLDKVIGWLTGFEPVELHQKLDAGITITEFFDTANLNPNAPLITGKICGVRIEEIQDPLMQKIRYMDKIVDELGNGRAMQKILRS
jgi:hypothetical protein